MNDSLASTLVLCDLDNLLLGKTAQGHPVAVGIVVGHGAAAHQRRCCGCCCIRTASLCP